MPEFTIEITPELTERLKDWSNYFGRPSQELVVELLEEYFDDCDYADRLGALIRSGAMEISPAETVFKELRAGD